MEYTRRFFAPPDAEPAAVSASADIPAPQSQHVYVFTESVTLAVNVALATERPLLIAGPPGSGKTTLARNVARALGWRYLQQVVTSRTRADDLLAGFDALRRLNDAQVSTQLLLPDAAYIEPGILWWAFDPESAARRGVREADVAALGDRMVPATYPMEGDAPNVVVLLDEIDKADPDVPNDLLEPLDRKEFDVRSLQDRVTSKGQQVLMVITTNGERELPPAFVRRCVFLNLDPMSRERLVEVAEVHFGPDATGALYDTLAGWLIALRDGARKRAIREPGTAEYLDTVRACLRLRADMPPARFEGVWAQVARAAMWKHDADLPPVPAGAGA